MSMLLARGRSECSPPYRRSWAGLVIGIAGVLAAVPIAAAGSGGIQVIDGRSYGLQMEISSQWLNGNGIRPFRVRLGTSPSRPSPNARKIRIVITPTVYAEPLVRVVDEIELPAGSRMVEKTIRVPQGGPWTECHVDVYEGDEHLQQMSGRFPALQNATNVSEWTEMLPCILIIDKDAPSGPGVIPAIYQTTRLLPNPTGLGNFGTPMMDGGNVTYSSAAPGMMSANPMGPGTGLGGEGVIISDPESSAAIDPTLSVMLDPPSDFIVLADVGLHPRQAIIPPRLVPTMWTELSAADLIFISLEDASQLAAQDPKKWSAIRTWAAAGHTLCIYQLGSDWQRLADVDQLLSAEEAFDWKEPPGEKAFHGFQDLQREFPSVGITTITSGPSDPQLAPFRIRQLGLGKVVAFSAEDPFLDQVNFGWMLASLEPRQRSWARRFGFSLNRANSSFGEWRIPGVGAPPVIMFLTLITLFAVGIGPVNYWWLRRGKRLHLLLVTVPLGGIMATGMLLAYALLSDGLYTRVRTRSFIHLDQPRQRAVTWSRQTYYSGMAPSQGLVFAESSLVMPIEVIPGERRTRLGELSWIGGQSLRDGFLQSRELEQYMVVDVSANSARLEVREGEPPSVTNELGGAIERLFVRLESGELYTGEKIEVGAQANLRPMAEANLGREIRTLMARMGRLDAEDIRAGRSWRPGRYWSNIDYNASPVVMNTSVLEQSLSGVQSGRSLVPRSYIAIVRNPSWLPVGVAQARRQDCFDVVLGKW